MGKYVSQKDVWKQSKTVFAQFGESLWIPNAKANMALPHKDAGELMSCGIGKVLVCVGMGASLEDAVEEIKKNRDKCDVVVCDKGFGPLLDHGVKADFVLLCDASIPFKFIEPWIDQTEGVKLIATPYANPEWTKAWKGERYHFIMRDAIESEAHFVKIMGRIRDIPAGSNVSNAILTFFLGCDEWNNKNWGGYERYLLVGYDYSWRPDGNYYAWMNPIAKRHYMNHRTLIDPWGQICFSSENLYFSVKWLASYLAEFKNMPVVNCCGRGLLGTTARSTLKEQFAKINPDPGAAKRVRQAYLTLRAASAAYEEAVKTFRMSREDYLWQ